MSKNRELIEHIMNKWIDIKLTRIEKKKINDPKRVRLAETVSLSHEQKNN